MTDLEKKKEVESNHYCLGAMVNQVVLPGQLIVSPGCGMAIEQGMFPQFDWLGLETDYETVLRSKESGKKVRWWDIYDDDLPEGDVLYLCHFCGGGTDYCLLQACEIQRYKTIMALTCCATKMLDLSKRVHSRKFSDKDWLDLERISREGKIGEVVEAQKKLDYFRTQLLRRHGFAVDQGWFVDKNGKLLPASSFIFASRK